MSKKVKSELSFIAKISILFIILFASKINRPAPKLFLNKSRTLKKEVTTLKNWHENTAFKSVKKHF